MAMSDQAVRTELMGENDPKTYENNYLVEAGAGAGKTYTMVQRIVNQLMNTDCAPQELVAITFTVKSTQEMKRRLDEELKERKKTAGEEEQRKLEKLIQEVGRMQISTIHSFCRTMLETMPFLSGMGPEMKLLENDSDFCRGFFHRKFWANPSAFDTVRKVYGLTYEVLENTFCNACHNGRAEIQYAPPGSADDNEARAIMKIAGDALHGQLHTTLEQIGDDWKYVKPELAELLKMPEPVFQADPSNAAKLASILNQSSSGLPLAGYDEDALKFKAATGWSMDVKQSNADYVKEHPLLDCWPEVKKAWTNGMGAVIKDAAARVVHTLCMSAIAPLADEYWEEKQKQHIVTQDDLLLRTRDMLKNSREAREYFHNRYKVLYVDEFQDTDPVQAEILFYLTSDPNQTNVTGWNSCTPEEGRLFLVGDPKQAIYRFRGADIGVYDMVKTAFGNKGICSLTRNYRSSDKLCKLTTTLFKCPAKVTKAGAKSYFVDENGKYPNPKQAKFAEMVAEQTVSGDQTHVFSYEPKVVGMADQKEVWSDADQVAAFIRTMVDKKIQIPNDDDDNGGTRAVSWKDFMILPARTKVIEEHVTAVSKLDIPVNVVGEQTLSSVNAIRRAVLHLKAMTATQDDYALMCLLHQCYQVPLKDLRVFMQRTKHKNIRGVLNPKTLHPIYKAFAQEEQPSEEMLSLCGILEELTELREMACSMPAMSVIERLLDGGYGIWDPAQPIQERRREYARVQQYLDLIRASELRSFSALAAFAIQCAETTLEYEMPLEAAPDQVQIMNLHKAKGLEGKIVILVNSTLPSFTDRHVFRDPDAKEYSCIKAKNKTLGWAKQWNHNKLQLKENPPGPAQ